MTKKKRVLGLVAVAAAAAMIMTGCSSSKSSDSKSTESSSSSTKTVTDATGAKVKIPANPKKIVTTHYAATQALLDLGVTPVGMGNVQESTVPTNYWKKIKDVPVIDNDGEVNVDKVAARTPDLILATNVTDQKVVDQLSKIAPVYRFMLRGKDRANWQFRVEEISKVVGQEKKFDSLKTAFEKRQKDIASKYKSQLDGKTLSIVDSYDNGQLYAWGSDSMLGSILTPLGLKWNPALVDVAKSNGEAEANVGAERLGDLLKGSDMVFYVTDLKDQPSGLVQSQMNSDLYKNSDAVKAGHAYPLGKATIAGFGDANFTLDMIEAAAKKM